MLPITLTPSRRDRRVREYIIIDRWVPYDGNDAYDGHVEIFSSTAQRFNGYVQAVLFNSQRSAAASYREDRDRRVDEQVW